MKNLFFSLLALFAVTALSAQEAETETGDELKVQIEKSEKRVADLKELCEKLGKKCGNNEVDEYAAAVLVAATTAISNSETLSNFYKREIGTTEDGVTDVTITKPTAEDWANLAVGIAGEAVSINVAKNLAENAVQSAKSQKNPMKAAKILKHCDASTKALTIVGEEAVESGKAVNQIIETIKSGKNL